MRKKLFSTGLSWLWVSLLVILLDRLSKYWALKYLTLYKPMSITPFFNLTLAYNTGAAFSFLHSASGWQNLALGGFAVAISIYILLWLAKVSVQEVWLNTSLCLIVGGALSNVCDRIQYGFVIDYFDFHWHDWHYAIFNIADSAICVGASLLILYWLFKK